MSILTLMKARLDSLTAGEREIAGFILDAPERMIQLSSASLAEATGRSQSSVVKLCQKLGYRGYQDFKVAVSQASAQTWTMSVNPVHGTIDASDSYTTTIEKLIGSKIHAMQQTLSVNTEDAMRRALDLIEKATRVQIVGVGASSLVARDLTYKLQKLGRMVIFDADSHVQVANAATLTAGDLVIALSQSGDSLETRRIAETASKNGAGVLTITGAQPNRLAELADVQLYAVAEEERHRSSAIFSRDAQLALIDLLFIQLVQTSDAAGPLIRAAEEAVSILKK
jgi:DNA-binding MurR/RpiR family transcriptional regulator